MKLALRARDESEALSSQLLLGEYQTTEADILQEVCTCNR